MRKWPDAEVILRETAKLRSLARSLVHDEHAVDDLLQDTWVSALENPPRIPEMGRFWLTKVLRNLVVDKRRELQSRRRRERVAAMRESDDVSTHDSLERLEVLRRIVELVAELEEPERSTVVHRFFDGMTLKQVAEKEQVAFGTVRLRIKRALEKLRKGLDRHFGGRSSWTVALVSLGNLGALQASTSVCGATMGNSGSVILPLSKTAGVIVWTTSKKTIAVAALSLTLTIGVVGSFGLFHFWIDTHESVKTTEPQKQPLLESEPTLADIREPEMSPRGSTKAANIAKPSLLGFVRSQGATPVPGAKIFAIHSSTWEETFVRAERQIWRYSNIKTCLAAAHTLSEELRSLSEKSPQARSAPDGSYSLFDLEAGQYRVLVAHAAYIPEGRDVFVGERSSSSADFLLAGGEHISGRVVDDETGIPLSGVSLEAIAMTARVLRDVDTSSNQSLLPILYSWREGRFLFANREAHSQIDGAFRIGPVAPGFYDVHAHRPGYAPLTLENTPCEPDDLEIRLVQGFYVQGSVVNTTGSAVVGAQLTLHEQRFDDMIVLSSRIVTGDTPFDENSDSQGHFTFSGVPDGRFVLRIEAEGFPTVEEDLLVDGHSVDLGALVLSEPLSIAGRVVGHGGAPVSSAEVWIEEPNRRGIPFLSKSFFVSDPLISTRTAPNGTFVIEGVPEGNYELRASATRFVPSRRSGVEAGSSDVEIRLQEGTTLHGIVLDGLSGARLPEAKVALAEGREARPVPQKVVWTDEFGRFELYGLEPGRQTLLATHPDEPDHSMEFEIEDLTLTAELEVFPSDWLSGRILDEHGDGVPNARIRCDTTSFLWRKSRLGPTQAISHEEGSFSLGVPTFLKGTGKAGFKLSLSASHPEYGNTRIEVSPPLEESHWPELEIVLTRPRSLSGRVVDSRGRPIAGAMVRVGHWLNGEGRTVHADVEGAYRFGGLESGEYVLTAHAVGFSITVIEDVVVDTEHTSLDVELNPGEILGGAVVDSRGRPVSDASVYAIIAVRPDFPAAADRLWHQRPIAMSRTDDDGQYTLAGLPSNDVSLFATAPGYARSATITVESNDAQLELVVRRHARIEGQLLAAATRLPISDFCIAVHPKENNDFVPPRRFNSPSGDFIVEQVLPGQYVVTVGAGGYRIWGRKVTLQPGQILQLEPLLEKGFTVSGRVFNTITGAGVPLAMLVAHSGERDSWEVRGEHPGRKRRSRADGSFTIDGLSTGKYRVRVWHPEYESETDSISITLPHDQENVLEFPMVPSGTVSGTITFREGRRWSYDRRVTLVRVDEEKDSFSGWLHGGARWSDEPYSPYLIRGVEPGAYSVYFQENLLPDFVGSSPPPPGAKLTDGVVHRQFLGTVDVVPGQTATFDSLVE